MQAENRFDGLGAGMLVEVEGSLLEVEQLSRELRG